MIVPGVGHFGVTEALVGAWQRAIGAATDAGTPLLGICVGMQWLFEGSDEAPGVPGLAVLPGRVQRLQGDGLAFIHAGGALLERTLGPGEFLRIDTGCLVAMQPSVDFDIQFVGNIKSAIFGGEGLFFATLRGPGKVWLQSLPLSRLANRIVAAAPSMMGRRREEGSVLGALGGILDGDNS